jgi:predicted enzyme related to lactoylglutathione lyase
MVDVASLVSAEVERTAAFYRAIGIALEDEQHDGGPVHHACELGPVHFAIYPAESASTTPGRRGAGSTFAGFYVDSLDAVAAALSELSAAVIGEHEQMPWGCRMMFQDPDGRPVEVNQQGHCPEEADGR